MTDKETIINKVNVNRCSVYKNGLNTILGSGYTTEGNIFRKE